ncbi:hypothetical protein HDU67_003169, partial [Dinochytrium kinnereticum]
QFTCGNLRCETTDPKKSSRLKSWEVNFAYREDGETKNALVKLRLCDPCAYMLNYRKIKQKQKEKEMAETVASVGEVLAKEKRRRSEDTKIRKHVAEDGEETSKRVKVRFEGGKHGEEDTSTLSRESDDVEVRVEEKTVAVHLRSDVYSKDEASKIWGAYQDSAVGDGKEEEEDGRDEEMDSFFEDLLMGL